MEEHDQEDQFGEYSTTKNVFGVDMSEAKPIGHVALAVSIVIAAFASISTITGGPSSAFIVAALSIFGICFSYYFSISEKEAMELNEKLDELAEEDSESENTNTKPVCRECREEISPDVKRCPHCGWKPTKRGGLWWGATAVTSLTPVGWALAAKGASDNHKAKKGVSEEVAATEKPEGTAGVAAGDDNTETSAPESHSKQNPTETLERIGELREQGVITEDEFQEKKEELLDQI